MENENGKSIINENQIIKSINQSSIQSVIIISNENVMKIMLSMTLSRACKSIMKMFGKEKAALFK